MQYTLMPTCYKNTFFLEWFLNKFYSIEIKGENEGGTVFENHRKSLIQHCERSEHEACGQTGLPVRSILI